MSDKKQIKNIPTQKPPQELSPYFDKDVAEILKSLPEEKRDKIIEVICSEYHQGPIPSPTAT